MTNDKDQTPTEGIELPTPDWWQREVHSWLAERRGYQAELARDLGIGDPTLSKVLTTTNQSRWVTPICDWLAAHGYQGERPDRIASGKHQAQVLEDMEQLSEDDMREFTAMVRAYVSGKTLTKDD